MGSQEASRVGVEKAARETGNAALSDANAIGNVQWGCKQHKTTSLRCQRKKSNLPVSEVDSIEILMESLFGLLSGLEFRHCLRDPRILRESFKQC